MHLGAPSIDWAGFLVEAEQDAFSMHYLAEWNELITCRLTHWAQKHQQRVHALGAGNDGKRRYVLSVWGESAQQVIHLPFAKWADLLTRFDVKRRLYDCRADTYERLCIALQFAETRRNIEAFKLPKRQKNTARDSGGEGVRFGSRKSDIFTKLSKRGNEVPYFETTIQDDKLDAMVLELLEQFNGAGYFPTAWEQTLFAGEVLADKHLAAWLLAAGIDKPIEGLRHEDIPMPKKLVELFQSDMFAWPGPLPEPEPSRGGTGSAKRERGG